MMQARWVVRGEEEKIREELERLEAKKKLNISCALCPRFLI
jgi:hypothetical protein